MSSSINTNMGSIYAQSNLAKTQQAVQDSLQKLSSGYRINSAADDAAGYAISQKMTSQINGLNQASSNAQDATSLIQTGDGALSSTSSILQRMRELAVQSSSDTNTASDRSQIQGEVDQLAKEVTRISNTTQFNTQNLLAGGFTGTFQIGANAGQNISLSIGAMDAQSLGVAGSQNSLGVTDSSSSTGVTGVTSLGSGLTAQTYGLVTTAKAATAATDVTMGTTAGGATGTLSASTTNTGGNYTGATDANLQVRTDAVSDTGAATAISVSWDGGSTWGASTSYTPNAAGGMDIGNGLMYTAASSGNVAQQTNSATLKAAAFTAQLQDSSGNNIGTAVNINATQTSATVGDSSTGATMDIAFSAGGIVDAQTDSNFQVVTNTASTAAVLSNGQVSTAANTVAGIDVSSQSSANSAITAIDAAINTVSSEQSQLGAVQDRLTDTISNLGTASTNLTSAQSNIQDVDMASEMSNFTKNQVLSQAGVAMLAQANQTPQALLKLLG